MQLVVIDPEAFYIHAFYKNEYLGLKYAKFIKEYDDRYCCDREGYIYSMRHNKWSRLTLTNHPEGYHQVTLYSGDKKRTHFLVHRIVASTWIPNPENKPTVDHINRVRTDNRVENLQWSTSKEQYKNMTLRVIDDQSLKSKYGTDYDNFVSSLRDQIKEFYLSHPI